MKVTRKQRSGPTLGRPPAGDVPLITYGPALFGPTQTPRLVKGPGGWWPLQPDRTDG